MPPSLRCSSTTYRSMGAPPGWTISRQCNIPRMASEDRYRLAPLRDVRTRDEKTRKGELASAVGDARETQAKLDAARARTQAARAVLDVALTTRDTELATGAQLAGADRFIARRRRELDHAVSEELRR